MKKIKACLPTKRGSILAYSLIIIAMMVAIVATMSVATVIEKKGASSTDFSVQAYQTADSGVQLAIKKIKASSGKTIGDAAVFPNCSSSDPDGTIIAESDYKLSFFKDEAGTIPASCGEDVSVVQSIKSIGKFKDTVRAVQVAVAATSGCRYVGATPSSYNGSGVGGYSGGDDKCDAAHPGSRMCTSSDFATGTPASDGWYSSFTMAYVNFSENHYANDCYGWTIGTGGFGPSWNLSGYPAASFCTVSQKVLCCTCN